MAEGTSGNPLDINQISVRSSEDPDTSQNSDEVEHSAAINVICKFFVQGTCRYGDNCWFNHDVHAVKDLESIQLCNKSSSGAGLETRSSASDSAQKKQKSRGNSQRKKALQSKDPKSSASGNNPPNWVNAPEFIPRKPLSYADSLKSNLSSTSEPQKRLSRELCFYFMLDECPFEQCPFIHGDICELCNVACLNPHDKRQRDMHMESCAKELEKDMELSFAIQCSINKTCGICMDVVMEKEIMSERRFGILENCNHVFCVSCIRKWRQVRNFDGSLLDTVINPKVTRSCPECRVPSDFVTPSVFWVESEEEKQKLISDYKEALSKKPCKHFKRGEGTCPFGGACFYLHAKPDGTIVKLPPPRKRQRQNEFGEIDLMEEILLWSYLETRDDVGSEFGDDIYIITRDSDDSME